jgi:hypothetical protein
MKAKAKTYAFQRVSSAKRKFHEPKDLTRMIPDLLVFWPCGGVNRNATVEVSF